MELFKRYSIIVFLLVFKNFQKSTMFSLNPQNGVSKSLACVFKRCLCSYNSNTDRYYLYCNDPNVIEVPDFSVANRTDLIFAKLDFSQSGIQHITGRNL